MDTTPAKTLIFLSHSSKDKELAGELAKLIEIELGSHIHIFVSTRPTAIQSGSEWFIRVIDHLEKAEILVILLTPAAENSVWVGFEFGYFWKKKNRSNVHILYHPMASIPNPLGTIQGKLITEPDQVADFLTQLCNDLKQPVKKHLDTETLITTARSLTVPPPERTFRKFEELLDHAEWIRGYIREQEVWTCEDDVLYQIVRSPEHEEFYEEWVKGFPDPTCNRWFIDLRVAGATIKQIYFISLDGGRYFVPMPEIRPLPNERRSFYWERNSLLYKVGKLVSTFYHPHESLETFAGRQGIEII